MFEFFLALFGVPILSVFMICEYKNTKRRDAEIQRNASLFKSNLNTWIQDVIDIKYEKELKEYYKDNGGYKQLWEDARNIISPYVPWYRSREYPPPKASFIPTLCYMIIMSHDKGKLPERVAKLGMPTVNYECFNNRHENDIVFSQTMWWVGERLKDHGINDNIVIPVDSTHYKYLTKYNKDAANRGTFKWERMVYPAFTIK